MSNPLNITEAFVNDVNKALHGDVTVSLAIIDETTKQAGTYYEIGAFKPEGNMFKCEQEFADLLVGVPQTLAHRACTKKQYKFESDLVNIAIENLALLLNAEIDDSDVLYKRLLLGSSIPERLVASMILTAYTEDGKQIDVYCRKVIWTADAIELALGGLEFSSIKFAVDLIQDNRSLETNWAWDVVDSYSLSAASCAGATGDWTMASTTGATVGDYVFSEANGFLGIITVVTTDVSITLDRNCAAESAVILKGATITNIKSDAIGYYKQEE